jgi:hypothetical protein
MIEDRELTFSDSQAITATAVSTDKFDAVSLAMSGEAWRCAWWWT